MKDLRYKKKPVIIHAWKWENINNIDDAPYYVKKNAELDNQGFDVFLMINTLEGKMRATLGDYIIKGVCGEVYPCKPDIFEMTYDKVEIDS